MAQPSVLDYETQLGFRRLYRHGWKAGLPRRRRKSTYPDYGRGREALSTLLSGIDAIKEPLAHIPVESYYQMLTAVREKADVPISSLGHSLWPIEDGKTPAFIDPETGLKFSNSADRESIKGIFRELVLAKAPIYWKNNSRYKDKKPKQHRHPTEIGSGDTSKYDTYSQGLMRGASKRLQYNWEIRTLADFQADGESQDASMEPSVSTATKQSFSLGSGDKRETDTIHCRPAKKRRKSGPRNQIAPSNTPDFSNGAVGIPRQRFRVQSSHGRPVSDLQNLIREGPTNVQTPDEAALGIRGTSLEPSIPLQDNSNQQATLQPPVMRSTAISLDLRLAPKDFRLMAPGLMKGRNSELPFSEQPTKALSHDARSLISDVSHQVKGSLNTLLKNTDVRLCFGDVDHIIMDLEGCYDLAGLFTNVQLFLKEEIGEKPISYIDVAQDRDEKFHVKGMLMKRLRLLRGSGRGRAYHDFLCLLHSPPLKGGLKMYVQI